MKFLEFGKILVFWTFRNFRNFNELQEFLGSLPNFRNLKVVAGHESASRSSAREDFYFYAK